MQNIINQFETEERTIREALLKIGYTDEYISDCFNNLKNSSTEGIAARNHTIRDMAKILKGVRIGWRPWLVHDLLSKITGLSCNYVQNISNNPNPLIMLKNGNKN